VSAKRPSIAGTFPQTREDVSAVKENIEIITGRRGQKNDLDGLDSMQVSAAPTQAEVEFLRAQLALLVRRLQA